MSLHGTIVLFIEASTRFTKEMSVPNQIWAGYNTTSNWSYQSHKVPCIVPWTTDYLSRLWAYIYQSRDKYYTTDSVKNIFETTPGTGVMRFLRVVGFFYRIWMVKYSMQLNIWISSQLMQFWTWSSPYNWITQSDLVSYFILYMVSSYFPDYGFMRCMKIHYLNYIYFLLDLCMEMGNTGGYNW